MTQLALREGVLAIPGTDSTVRGADRMRARGAGPAIELGMIRDRAGIQSIEAEWNRLHAEHGGEDQVFQTFAWCWHWCRHFLDDREDGPELAVVTGRLAGRLFLVLPLVVVRRAGLRELNWLGEPVSQYGDVLASSEARQPDVLLAAWRFAVAQTRADVANLRKVRGGSIADGLLAAIGTVVTATEEAPYLDLSDDETFEAWEARRQPRARKNRKRQARRLTEMGEVVFSRDTATAEAGELARHAVELKRLSLASKGAISPALADPHFADFFGQAAASTDQPTGIVVRGLNCDGKPAALKVLLENETTCCLHVAAFDAEFEKCGAGAVLLEQLIRQTIDEGRKTLDLLAPRHGYKMDFADGVVLVNDHAAAMTVKGWVYLNGFLRLRRRLKALIEALPAPVRRGVLKLVARGA